MNQLINVRGILATIRVPTLVIAKTGDPLLPPGAAKDLASPSRTRDSSSSPAKATSSAGAGRTSVEVTTVSERVGGSKDVKEGHMRVFDVGGTNVNVANANGHLYAFDDTCTHMGCS